MQNITPFPPFDYDIDKSNAGPRWEKWVKKLENLFIGMNLKDSNRKKALLLHYVGDSVYDIYEAEKSSSDSTYEETKQVLTSYFEPKRNIQMDIFNFRSCKQKANQSLDDFVTELRQLAKYCNFLSTDDEILSQVIQHCKSSRLRKRALREPDKTLKEILELGRSLEMVDKQAAAIEDEAVNAIKNPRSPNKTTRRKPDLHKPAMTSRNIHSTKKTNQAPQKTPNTCLRCGGKYPHDTPCPAMGKICNYCKKPNHFKSVCLKLKRKNQVNSLSQENPEMIESSDESDDDYCYSIRNSVNNIKTTLPEVSLKLDNVNTSLLIDTGSTVNVIDENMYNQLGKPKLNKGTQSNL